MSILYGKEIAAAENPEELKKKRLEEYRSQWGKQPYHAAGLMRIEEIIDPRDTRPMLIKALNMMGRKTELKYPKKHGNIPL